MHLKFSAPSLSCQVLSLGFFVSWLPTQPPTISQRRCPDFLGVLGRIVKAVSYGSLSCFERHLIFVFLPTYVNVYI